MATLTLNIDEDVLRRARVRADEGGTSVNAVVREFLSSYAAVEEQAAALASFLDLAAASEAGSSGGRRNWTRDELYVERIRG